MNFLTSQFLRRAFFIPLIVLTGVYLQAPVQAADGQVDESFISGQDFDSIVRDVAFQGEKLVVVGYFNTAVGYPSRKIVRLEASGNIDQTFNSGIGANADIGQVEVLADGKILIAGGFTQYNGSPVKYIARLNADGSLDTSFNDGAGPNGGVSYFDVDPNGRILIVGGFTAFDGVSRTKIARLEASGDLDASFVMTQQIVSGGLEAVKALSDGKVMVGGSFNGGLIRLQANGAFDPSFIVSINGPVHVIRQTPAGVIAGGDFTAVSLNYRPGLVRFVGNTVDPSFFAPRAKQIRDITVLSDGRMLVCGELRDAEGHAYPMARLSSAGTEDQSYLGVFSFPNGAQAWSVAIGPDGNAVFGGLMNEMGRIDSAAPTAVIKIDPSGDRILSFLTRTAAISSGALSLFNLADGRMMSWGGGFYWRPRLARLSHEGIPDIQFAPVVDNFAAVSLNPDGSGIVAGTRSRSQGPFPFRQVSTDGTVSDLLFASGTYSSSATGNVLELARQADGKLIAVGDFDTINGVTRRDIVRLNIDGSVDQSFSTNIVSLDITKVIVSPQGRIFIAVRPQANINWAAVYELDQNGAVVWQCRVDPVVLGAYITNLTLLSDGNLLVSGRLGKVNNVDAPQIARIKPNGEVDQTFIPPNLGSPFSTINSVLQLIDGRVMIGGEFPSIDGIQTANLGRLLPNGNVDPTFIATVTGSTNPSGIPVISMVQQESGKLIVSGNFTAVNGSVKRGIVRFEPFSGLVTISGRVTTPGGLGLRNAVVRMTDLQSNLVRTATTSSFGFYSFTNVLAQTNYFINPVSKRYRFTGQDLNASGNLTNIDFVGLE
ncbi:MAG TPA: hypothetical protein PLP21_03275 [Pyrinomonadaceae bacterium]|nr:hypothetical protein [Acidobacteriota bacterium]HQZ95310.1 hypothetical protein [Pyrinomonadaceae bacterium]